MYVRSNPRLGFCVSMLGKSRSFVTSDFGLKRAVRLLPDSACHINVGRHVLIKGNRGVGKRTLVFHCWQKLRRIRRPLIGERCQFIRKLAQLRRRVKEAEGGDLFLDNVGVLPTGLLASLPAIVEDTAEVRVIATCEKMEVLPDGFLTIHVPGLAERPGDCRLLAAYLLMYNLRKTISSQLLDNLLAVREFVSTRDLYIFLVNMGFVSECMGLEKLNQAVLDEVLRYTDRDLLRNYFIFLTNRTGIYQMIDDYGLRNVSKLAEDACITSAMIEARCNQSFASRMLNVPSTTLSSKKTSLPPLFSAS